MNHNRQCENGCDARKQPAVWKSGELYFCHACHEEIIDNKPDFLTCFERISDREEEFEAAIPRNAQGQRAKRWPKREFPKARPLRNTGVKRIADGTTERGVRWVCRTAAAWEQIRIVIHDRAKGKCERCGAEAPLHDRVLAEIEAGDLPRILRAGQAAHIVARKMGGGFRDDHPDNLAWLCGDCHRFDPQCRFLQAEVTA